MLCCSCYRKPGLVYGWSVLWWLCLKRANVCCCLLAARVCMCVDSVWLVLARSLCAQLAEACEVVAAGSAAAGCWLSWRSVISAGRSQPHISFKTTASID